MEHMILLDLCLIKLIASTKGSLIGLVKVAQSNISRALGDF